MEGAEVRDMDKEEEEVIDKEAEEAEEAAEVRVGEDGDLEAGGP